MLLVLGVPFLIVAVLLIGAWIDSKGWIDFGEFDPFWWIDDDDFPPTGCAVVTTVTTLEAF